MTGATLFDLVKEKGPLPPELALRKILDVIEGLHEAHALGLVHRDVKPSNCFLEAGGRVKIGDFGLAKSLARQAHLTRTGWSRQACIKSESCYRTRFLLTHRRNLKAKFLDLENASATR